MKEPHYFAEELDAFRKIRDQSDYHNLFAACTKSHHAIGEASVYYLYYSAAMQRIVDAVPHAKALVMVRNPVDLVHSLHEQLLATFHEDEPDLERAWGLQSERAAGRRIPADCRLPQMLQYAQMGRIGTRVKEALRVFGAEQLHVILYDDFVADTRAAYLRVLEFLELEDDGQDDFPRVNQSRKNRLPWLGKLMNRPPRWLVAAKENARRITGEGIYRHATQLYLTAMTRKRRRPPLRSVFRQKLAREFDGEIGLLESLLERDLSAWRAGGDVFDGHPA